MSLVACKEFCSAHTLSPRTQPGILGTDGLGPSIVGRLVNFRNTGKEKFRAISHQSVHSSLKSQLLEKPGQNLFTGICKTFFQRIAKAHKNLILFHSFYTKQETISEFRLEDLQQQLETEIRARKNEMQGGPIVIPIAMGRNHLLEATHIAIIKITDNNVYYYDSKGVPSKNRKIQEGHTIRDFIEVCQKLLTDGKGTIEENKSIHQWDCYNCGAYTSHYLFQTMIMNKTHSELENSEVSLDYILQFRKAMATDLDTR